MEKILVIDDSAFICGIIEATLGSEGFEVVAVHAGEQALGVTVSEKPDLILLDVILPGMDGYGTCRLLKANPLTAEIPVLFITSSSDDESLVKAFAAGGADYIPKPFSTVELLARVKAHVKNKLMTDLLKSANDELERTNQKLAEMLEEKRQWAMRDSMTGLYNRHFFKEQQPRWNDSAQAGVSFCIALLDVDDFKKVNDQYGHCLGDYILCTIADIICNCCEKEDVAIRWGGEEFLVVMPQRVKKSAAVIAEQIRKVVSQYPFSYEDVEITCTVTIGIAVIDPTLSVEKNIARADASLYKGKKSGKNCMICFD